jgi:ribosomal-protein-serine acetyltransferase
MKPPDRIYTERFLLRRFARKDADAILAAVEASLPDLTQWLPWAHEHYTKDEAIAYVRDSMQSWKEGRAYDFAIRSPNDPGSHLGNMSVWHVSRLGKVGEIGYWVRSDATSKGIATETAAAMLDLGFTKLGMHKITLRIAVGNDASDRVAQKLGFTREGILREELKVNGRWLDHTLYSMLEQEFRRSRQSTVN